MAADLLKAGEESYGEIGAYTRADKARFEAYLGQRIAMVNLPNKDEAFLRERLLTMYANPVFNSRASKQI